MQQQQEQPLKLKASTILFGPYVLGRRQTSSASVQVTHDCLALTGRLGQEIVRMQISFKCIEAVELVHDPNCCAGMIVHVNLNAARKIQNTMDPNSDAYLTFTNPYAAGRYQEHFFVFDILNCEPDIMHNLRTKLAYGERVHSRYIAEQCIKKSATYEHATPYIASVATDKWKALLASLGRTLHFETIECFQRNKKISYGSGAIVPIQGLETNSAATPNGANRVPSSFVNGQHTWDTSSMTTSNAAADTHHPVASHRSHPSALSPPRPLQVVQNARGKVSSPASGRSLHTSTSFTPRPVVTANGGGALGKIALDYSASSPASSAQGTPTRQEPSTSSTPATLKKSLEVMTIESDEEESAAKTTASPAKRPKGPKDAALNYLPGTKNTVTVTYKDLKYLCDKYMLNDTIIDFYLKYIHNEVVPADRRTKIFMFNTYFYSRCCKPAKADQPSISLIATPSRARRVQNNYKMLKRWTNKVNVFNFDYIILPINEDIHWFLCAIVNPRNGIVDADSPASSQNGKAESEYPPVQVVVFDSLIEDPERHEAVQDVVGEYLRLEYEERRTALNLPGNAFRKESLQLIVPTGTPQQKNYVECGVFLLHFAELFMTQPPTKYVPEIDFDEWYPDFEIKSKRRRIKYILQKLTEFKDIELTDFVFLPGDPLKKEMVDGSIEMKALSIPERTRRHSTSTLIEYDKNPLFYRHTWNPMKRSHSQNNVTEIDYDQTFIERERKLWRQRQAAEKAAKARHQ